MNSKERAAWFLAFLCLIVITAGISLAMLSPDLFQKWTHFQLPVKIQTQSDKNEDKDFQRLKLAFEVQDTRFASLAVNYLSDFPEGKYSASVMALTAEYFYRQNKKEEARAWVNRAAAEKKGADEARLNIARIMGLLMKEDGVFDPVYTRFLENCYLALDGSGQKEISAYLGYAYLYSGDLTNAMRYFLLGSGETAVLGKARVYIRQGYYPEAFQEYENYLTLYPEGSKKDAVREAYLKQAAYYSKWLVSAKRGTEALAIMDKVSKRYQYDPVSADFQLNAGQLAAELKSAESARRWFTIAGQLLPPERKAAAILGIGLADYQSGQKTKAAEAFQLILDQYSTSAEAEKAKEWLVLLEKEARYGRP